MNIDEQIRKIKQRRRMHMEQKRLEEEKRRKQELESSAKFVPTYMRQLMRNMDKRCEACSLISHIKVDNGKVIYPIACVLCCAKRVKQRNAENGNGFGVI